MSTHFGHLPVSVGLLLFPTVEDPLCFDLFRQRFPQVKLVAEKIVDEGRIVTAGGVSSGIDLALHFLEQWFGVEARKSAAKRLDGPWN